MRIFCCYYSFIYLFIFKCTENLSTLGGNVVAAPRLLLDGYFLIFASMMRSLSEKEMTGIATRPKEVIRNDENLCSFSTKEATVVVCGC